MRHNWKVWGVLSLVFIGAGCGGGDSLQRLTVSGEVLVNGAPLEQGNIVLLPEEGTPGPSAGASIKNGKFEISRDNGPAPGKHKIQITSYGPTGKKVTTTSEDDGSTREVDEIVQSIPEKYNQQSTLIEELNSKNSRQLSFKLESP